MGEPAENNHQWHKRKRILIVDDMPENIDLLRGVLSPQYDILVAKSGFLALKIAESNHPDLILLDVMMPTMNGFEVCRHLKADPAVADIPVIFVTAMNDVENEEKGFKAGGVDFITKPIKPLTTLARVDAHLTLAEQHQKDQITIAQRTLELNDSLESAISMLAEAGHFNDTETGSHMWRMAEYSAALARAYGWAEKDYELLKMAAPMHDTGKIGIPDAILKAPRKLTPEEFDIMKQHSTIGYQILAKSSAPLFQLAAEVALYHHEKWDGSGYPAGVKGREIPESARIVAIADVFDALTSIRPYKHNWSLDEAFQLIKESSGVHFDPELVECFLSIKSEILAIMNKWQERDDSIVL